MRRARRGRREPIVERLERRHDRRVIDRVSALPSRHARRHAALVVLNDHAILFGDEEPGPKRR